MRSLVLKSAVLGLGLIGIASSQASAVTIYGTTFNGSVAPSTVVDPAGSPAFLPGNSLAGQNGWTGFVNPTGTPNVPLGGTFAYNPGLNAQYALITALNNATGSSGFYAPTHASYTPGVSGTDQVVAITFSMNVLLNNSVFPAAPYSSNAANDEFFGVTAFNGADEIASLGLNHRTGQYVLPVGATVVNSSPFSLGAVGLNVFHGYRLLLDYSTQTWSISSQLAPNPLGTYTIDAYGSFANAATTFTDADLAAFNLGSGTSNGYAQFDDYTVRTLVPEPTSLAVAGLASGLLLGRRRRSM